MYIFESCTFCKTFLLFGENLNYMSDELKRLNEIANFFRRMNSKLLLVKLLNKAKDEYDKYDFESGKESLLKAYELEPDNPVVLRGLGCLEQFGSFDYDKAIEYFLKALEFSDAKEIEYTLIGMAYYLSERLDEAVKYFNLAIDENDEYPSAYEGRNQAMLENHLKIIDLQDSLKKYF